MTKKDTKFKEGNPGRPKGSKNKNPKKEELEELWSSSIDTLRAAIATGDVKAAQFVVERFVPSLKAVEHTGQQSVEVFLMDIVKQAQARHYEREAKETSEND